nr:DNA/RNA non-specific endonuclease [Butyrivibrio sp.]
ESDSPYLQNRCHILCYAASGLNEEKRNLITGTRTFNLAMLDSFEIPMIEYAEANPEMHILYRGTPVFVGNELMARGMLLEAESVEDHGATFKMCKYFYNIQKNVTIDYATGESSGPEFTGTDSIVERNISANEASVSEGTTYIANSNSMRFHTTDCENAAKISDHNKVELDCTRQEAIEKGYSPAGCCNP